MPVFVNRVHLRAGMEYALGGERVLGFRFRDLTRDTEAVIQAGMGLEMVENLLEVLELTSKDLAQLLEVPVGEIYYRRRPDKEGKPPKVVVRPGEETRRVMVLVRAHGHEAAVRRMVGATSDGVANHFICEKHPELAATGLELARTESGSSDLKHWFCSRPLVEYKDDELEEIPGHEGRFPKRPLPWQRQKKRRKPGGKS